MSEPDVEDFLAHYGVKGMKWGVRKNRNRVQVKERSETRTVKTKSGATLTMSGDKTPAMAKLLSRLSEKYATDANNYTSYTLKDPSGKTVGEMSVAIQNGNELNVVWVGVRESARGHGYASAAMKGAEAFARQEGMKKMTLEVPGNSPDARHIYEKMGFKEVGNLGEDDVWGGLTEMEKSL